MTRKTESELNDSSGSSSRVRGGGEKHEIYVAAFGGHLFYDLFLWDRGSGHGPLAPPPWSATEWPTSRHVPIQTFTSCGSKRGCEGRKPPWGFKFFQFHAIFFFWKFWPNRMLAPPREGWRPHLGEILDPPLFTVQSVDLHVSIRAGKAGRFCR